MPFFGRKKQHATDVADATVDKATGLPVYGMDKDAAAKTAAKWSEGGGEQMQADARTWIEAVLGAGRNSCVMGQCSLQEELKNGVVLCNLVNKIQEGCCQPPSMSKMPFKPQEKIGRASCRERV